MKKTGRYASHRFCDGIIAHAVRLAFQVSATSKKCRLIGATNVTWAKSSRTTETLRRAIQEGMAVFGALRPGPQDGP